MELTDDDIVAMIAADPTEFQRLPKYFDLPSDRLMNVTRSAMALPSDVKKSIRYWIFKHPRVTPEILRVVYDAEPHNDKASVIHMSYEQIMGIIEEQRDDFLASAFSLVSLNLSLTAEQLFEIAKISFQAYTPKSALNSIWLNNLVEIRHQEPKISEDFIRMLAAYERLPASAAFAILALDSTPDDVRMGILLKDWPGMKEPSPMTIQAARLKNPAVDVFLEHKGITYVPPGLAGDERLNEVKRSVVFYLREYAGMDVPDGIHFSYVRKLLEISGFSATEEYRESFPRDYIVLRRLEEARSK